MSRTTTGVVVRVSSYAGAASSVLQSSSRPSQGPGATAPSTSSSSRSSRSAPRSGCAGGGGSPATPTSAASFQLIRTRRVSSTSTVIGTVEPATGHFAIGTRPSRITLSKVPRPGATTIAWISARPYAPATGGSVMFRISAVPATVARPLRRTLVIIASAIARPSTTKPKIATGQLCMPSPRKITNAASVPMTHATNLRAGAMGRPAWFATVDLPVVPRQVMARRSLCESAAVQASPLTVPEVPIG